MKLTDSVQFLKGIGEKKAKRFEKLRIKTVQDLLFHFPMRYEDRSIIKSLSQIANDERVCSYGTIIDFEKSTPRRNMVIIKIVVQQGNEIAFLTMFNNEYVAEKFSIGDKVSFYGKATKVFNRIEFKSPDIEHFGEKKITGIIFPVYHLTAGITNMDFHRCINQVIGSLKLDNLEVLPKEILEKHRISPIAPALKSIHFPENINSLKVARYRFVYQDFFMLQIYILMMKKLSDTQNSYPLEYKAELEKFLSDLPFELTTAQKNVIEDLKKDFSRNFPMQRLVQGDVGSGKTIIAFYSALYAFLNGYQSAIMVPTEILAKQHFNSAKELFGDIPIRVRLLIGSTPKKEKESIYKEIENHECDLVIGTHALIEEKVNFPKLALAITDEQHRFGVKQRSALYSNYDITPHILVLTATPIPRTLSMILHGDLDVSLIKEMPKGRIPIKTLAVEQKLRGKAYERCISELEKGRQVYIVCPLVEESEELDIKSAEELFSDLQKGIFKGYTVGLIHGKLKPKQKNDMMNAFENKIIDVLVSTTVIEVGINVPNATVMVIEDAQRFGLSQLHQLRGRVGRGTQESYCILVYKGSSDIMKQRMSIMSETGDGFKIAEKDLELRGPGEMFGLRQHGLPEFRIADITKHIEIMELAQKDAVNLIENTQMYEKYKATLLREIKERFEKEIQEIALN